MEAKISIAFKELRVERKVLVMTMDDTPCMKLLEKRGFITEV